MANTSLGNNVLMNRLFGGKNAPPLKEEPKEGGKGKEPTPAEKFANWANTNDTKVASKDLMNRGLIGADQMYNESQRTGNADEITNKNQSDWKVSAIEKILEKAYQGGIKTPTGFLLPENRPYLLSGLDPRIKDAINDPRFNQIHPNFWQILGNSILPQQWAKEDAANKNAVVKK